MVAKSKEQPVSDKKTSTKAAKSKSTSDATASAKKSAAKKTTAKKSGKTTAQKTQHQKTKAASSASIELEATVDLTTPELPLETPPDQNEAVFEQPASDDDSRALVPSLATSAHRGLGTTGLDIDAIAQNLWQPNASIPTLDEATYAAQIAQAEGQRRAIEVAKLNLKNINELQDLERQNIEAAISAKTNETRTAQLTGADIDYQTQLEFNGEKSQQLNQAAAKREAATRETGYMQQLISLKDQNFELEVQQAQAAFSEKAARYRAQLTGN